MFGQYLASLFVLLKGGLLFVDARLFFCFGSIYFVFLTEDNF